MKTVDLEMLKEEWTPEQLAEAIELTRKKMNIYKILTLASFLLFGIGLILPFGKLAQLYTMGYAQLRGKHAPLAAGWAFLGLLMSMVMVFIGKVFPSLICTRFVYPSNY